MKVKSQKKSNDMINDDSLGDRLNAVKKGVSVPKPPAQVQSVYTPPVPQSEQNTVVTLKTYLISRAITIMDSFIASFIYGFAIKTLFGLDWSLFAAFTVGFLFNHAISIFPKVLFPKWFK
jgi:hypothetical protein